MLGVQPLALGLCIPVSAQALSVCLSPAHAPLHCGLASSSASFCTDWTLCTDPGPNLYPFRDADVPAPSSPCPGHTCQGCGPALGHLGLWLPALHGAALLMLLFAGLQWLFLAAGSQPLLVPEAPDSAPGQDTPTSAVQG